MKLSHDRIRVNGAFGPGGLPWGYVVSGDKYNKTIKPTDVCKKYAPQIFDRCIDGDSRRTIAAWLDSEKVKPKRGKKWSEGSVGHILTNMTYAGRRQDKDGNTIMRCEAVIDTETFNRAQDALKNRPKRGPVRLDNRPMLANLKCARCEDSPMFRIGLNSRSGRMYYYYRCTGRGPQRKGCGNMVPLEATEYIVAVKVGMTSTEPYRIKTWIKGENWESEMLDIEQSIRELNPRSKEDRKRRDELEAQLDDYASREVVPGQWEHKDVLNPDGSVQTVGEYFFGLDAEGRREYLKSRDIRVERVNADFGVGSRKMPMLRIVLDGKDIGTTPITHELTRDVLGITEKEGETT